MKQLLIIGAGGHGRVAAEIAELKGYSVSFLDDSDSKAFNVIGKLSDYKKYISTHSFFVAIGNSETRKKVFCELKSHNAETVNLVHPYSFVSKGVAMGTGNIVMAGAVVNTNVRIGDGVIINTCSSVDHDSVIEDFSHIAVGSRICGTVKIGEGTWIGAGATVINNITITDKCMIGAGAVVIKDIHSKGTYVGVPAAKCGK